MEIKLLDETNLKEALNLVWNVFSEFEAPEYPDEGVSEFKDTINFESMLNKLRNSDIIFWGAFDKDNLTGIIATRNTNHITLLFVDKKYHKQGIGKFLFHTVLASLKKVENINTITVNSSPYAVKIYMALGFTPTDNEQIVNGIRFTPMKYTF